MSDHLEDFMNKNRDQFDQSNPGNELWDKINQGLNQAAAGAGAGAGSSAGSTAAGTAAKTLAGWKLAAIIATVAVTGVGVYLGVSGKLGGGTDPNGKMLAEGDSTGNQKVELIEEANPAAFIQPAFPGADVPFGQYTIPAKEGGVISLDNGTVVNIPENAFVFEDGTPVAGEVQIGYREFHDAADIILSGIPMKFNNNGKMEDFQTAGMVEIQGTQGEKPVFIAQGKSIQIDMASFVDEDNYNLYFLDQDQREWQDIGKAKIKKNKAKDAARKNLTQIPAKPVKATQSESVFELSIDYNEFPELKPYKKVIWEPADKAYMDKNEWIWNMAWSDIELAAKDPAKGIYEIRISSKKHDRKFKFEAIPALEGKDYQKALADFNKKSEEYQQLLGQRKNEEERLNRQADLNRSFAIYNFGIYNCDRFYRIPNVLTLDFNIDFGDDQAVRASNTVIFHIVGNERAVLPYQTAAQMSRLSFCYEEDNFMVAILPNKKVGILYPSDFRSVPRAKLVKEGKLEAKMHVVDANIQHAGDLRKLLHI